MKNINKNLAKLGNNLNESPTVMVTENNKQQLGKNRGILKPRPKIEASK